MGEAQEIMQLRGQVRSLLRSNNRLVAVNAELKRKLSGYPERWLDPSYTGQDPDGPRSTDVSVNRDIEQEAHSVRKSRQEYGPC